MPLTNDKTALFIHIPKCAGTSLEIAMGYGRRYPTLGESRTATTPDYDDLFGGGLQHLSIREVVENYPDRLTRVKLRFAIIRSPVPRMISAYGWKTYRFNRANLPSPQVMAGEFEDWFVETLPFLENNSILENPLQGMLSTEHAFDTPGVDEEDLRHLMPQTGFIYNRGRMDLDLLINFDFIPEAQNILKSFAVNVGAIPHRMRSVNATEVEKNVSEKCRKRIMELYRYDLELYEKFKGRACVATTTTDSSAGTAVSFPGSTKQRSTKNKIPKKLFMYWHQGWDNAPDCVKRCAATWQRHNPAWDINLLDAATIGEKVKLPAALKALDLPLPALSDVIRIYLLKKYGGVWADATLWCTRPLDDWIESVCDRSGFFAYDKPGADRPVSSWFLAASTDCRIVDLWHSAVRHLIIKAQAYTQFDEWFDGKQKTWLTNTISHLYMNYYLPRFKYGNLVLPTSENPGVKNYFWFHYLFGKLLEQNSEFHQLWASTPKISADGPHLLQREGLFKPATDRTDFAIKNKFSNVFKLTRRKNFPDDITGTVLDTLYRSGEGRRR